MNYRLRLEWEWIEQSYWNAQIAWASNFVVIVVIFEIKTVVNGDGTMGLKMYQTVLTLTIVRWYFIFIFLCFYPSQYEIAYYMHIFFTRNVNESRAKALGLFARYRDKCPFIIRVIDLMLQSGDYSAHTLDALYIFIISHRYHL